MSRFYPKSEMARAVIDQVGGPQYAYLRIYNQENKMNLVFWFNEEPWQDAPCLVQAQDAARALDFD